MEYHVLFQSGSVIKIDSLQPYRGSCIACYEELKEVSSGEGQMQNMQIHFTM